MNTRPITTRPFGLGKNISWEPRDTGRGKQEELATYLVSSFVELVEKYPWIQQTISGVFNLVPSVLRVYNGPNPLKLPDPFDAWRFIAIGDYGSGRQGQADVARNIRNANPEIILTTGDNVYPSGREQDYERNFDPPHLYGGLLKLFPFMPSLGNHDIMRNDLRPYFKRFKNTKGQPYYTYTVKNVSFVALDTNQDLRVGSKQYRWLVKVLKSIKTPWKVVYFHYPLFGSNPEDNEDLREVLTPLFEKYGVQLVFNGHEHNYQRSIPIRGVTYITTGGGGQQVYPFLKSKPLYIARRGSIFHHIEVAVGAAFMVVRAIDRNGKVYDSTAIPAEPIFRAKDGASLIPQRFLRRP